MAVYHGKSASVKKATVAVQGLQNWTIESAVDLVEANDFGDTWKSNEAGLASASGSMEGLFDPANTQQAALMNAILTASPIAKLTDVVFYIDATKNFSGDIWITGFSAVSNIGDLVKVTFSFTVDGILSYSPT